MVTWTSGRFTCRQSFDIYGMPVHPLVLEPRIWTLVTLSKHSLIIDDPSAKYLSVIVSVPAVCVIDKERYPSLSVDVCNPKPQLGLFVGLDGLFVGNMLEFFVGDLLGVFVGDVVGLFVEGLVGLFVRDLLRLGRALLGLVGFFAW